MSRPYQLPHSCESAEIAKLLSVLSPRQRRVLREYVWRVELGELSITEWLRSEDCPVSARAWYASGERANYLHSEAFQAALRAYRSAGQRWQVAEEQKQIARAHATLVRATPRAAERIVEHAQADMSELFKMVERWTERPLPTQEILEERRDTDEDGQPVTLYRVRATVLDPEKLRDPRFGRLIRRFKDSPKDGLIVELYDAQRAAEAILDRADAGTANKSGDPDGSAADWWAAANQDGAGDPA